MASTARELGFVDVEVIDEDLGSSASIGAKIRTGFERLLAHIALGEVGIVLCKEVSRLSRTDKSWCQLFEVCQMFDTLVGDGDNIYDLSTTDDQLVMGIKGTLTVVELGIIRQRLLQGRENKARRGAYYTIVPPGYILDNGHPIKDPNTRVQESISLVFTKFRELCSIRQTYKWFSDNMIKLPVNKSDGIKSKVVFQVPLHSFIRDMLKNPFYAGAYVYGRRPIEPVFTNGILTKRQSGRYLEPEEARIFLRDNHEGYIDWQTYEENRTMIHRNNQRSSGDQTVGAVRAGQGLLAGLLRCGRCGRKIYVRYWGKSGTSARYLCSGSFAAGGRYCLGFGGRAVDQRVSQEVLQVASPLGIQASLAAIRRLEETKSAETALLEQEVVSAEYEARRAFEQYNEVDPRNRIVASELERRWNDKLEAQKRAEQALKARQTRSKPLSEKQRQELLALGSMLPEAWHSPACSVELKKKIIRTVIQEIVVDLVDDKLEFVIHWSGGIHTKFTMDKPQSGAQRRNSADDLQVIRQMATRYGDGDIARVLSKQGRKTGNGNPWNRHRVKSARSRQGIPGRSETKIDPEILTLNEAARLCGVSDTTIVKLVRSGILSMNQITPYAPWEIRRADLESQVVQNIVADLKATGRLRIASVPSEKQQRLF